MFLLLENFTNSDKTPPFIDTYLQLFPNFGNHGEKLSDKNKPGQADPILLPKTGRRRTINTYTLAFANSGNL